MKLSSGLTRTIRVSLLAVLTVSIALMTACPEPDSGVDKSSLRKKITEANSLYNSLRESTDGSDVSTTEQWVSAATREALKNAVDRAQAVYNKSSATAVEVSDALTALDIVVNDVNSEKRDGTVDKSQLNAKITEANDLYNSLRESIDGTDIPRTEQWVSKPIRDLLKTAIDDAQKIADKANATAREVNTAFNTLRSAINTVNSEKKAGTS